MKKKLLSLCAIILCLSFVLVGCGGNGAKFKLYAEEVKAITTGEVTEVNLGTNIELVGTVSDVEGQGYVKIHDTKGTEVVTDDTYGVYSLKDSKIIFNTAKSDDLIMFFSTEYYTYFTVETETVPAEGENPAIPGYYTLYSPNGEEILSNLDIQFDEWDDITNFGILTTVKYDGVVYESWEQQLINENKYEIVVKVTGEKATDRKILYSTKMDSSSVVGAQKTWAYNPDCPLEWSQYLMSVEDFSTGIIRYHIYDLETGKEISTFELDAAKNPCDPLFVGNVWYIQYDVQVDPYETKDYDYIESGEKFKLETYKINMETGKITKIKADHKFYDTMNNRTLLENKAAYFVAERIVNKQLIGEATYFATEKGLVEVDREYEYVEKHGDNYIAISGSDSYIIDKSGKVLVDLSAYNVEMATLGGVIITKNSKYGFIDYTGKFITNGYEYDDLLNVALDGYLIATKTLDSVTTYYRVDEKTFAATAFGSFRTGIPTETKLGETVVTNILFREYFYIVIKEVEAETPTYTYEFYKNDGTLLKSVTGVATAYASMIMDAYNTDENSIYNLIEFNDNIYQVKCSF